jgi:hypothetical protein
MSLNYLPIFLHASIGEVYRNKRPEYVAKLLTPSGVTSNKGKTMANRYRIEIFDEIKSNDLTLYSDQGMNRVALSELVFSYANNFQGNVRAFAYDTLTKKKVTGAYLPMDMLNLFKSKIL